MSRFLFLMAFASVIICTQGADSNTVGKTNVVEWLSRACKNDSDALSRLVDYYCKTGIGDSGFSEALDLLSSAARRNNSVAQLVLGITEAAGRFNGQTNLVEAFRWYGLSAAQGNQWAQFYVAQSYYMGLGCETNINKAVEFFRMAAQQGLPQAQWRLGAVLLKDATTENEGFEWIKKAADQNFSYAAGQLGCMYLYGMACQKDTVKAEYYLKNSAEHGLSVSQFNLAEAYCDGTFTTNIVESVHWCAEAATNKHVVAQYKLGLAYMAGIGIKEDVTNSYYWIRKSADAGYAPAEFDVCEYLTLGVGCEIDKNEADRFMARAAAHGFPRAMTKMYLLTKATNDAVSVSWLNLAVEKNDPEALYILGMKRTEAWLTKDELNIDDYFKSADFNLVIRSAESGWGPACSFIGGIYLDVARTNVTRRKEGVQWLYKGAGLGDKGSLVRLGEFHTMSHFAECNPKEGVACLRRAASIGSTLAYLHLGDCYLYGVGLAKDEKEAFKCYEKASAAGIAKAQYRLGTCYEFGSGVTKDLKLAFTEYEKSAKAGDEDGLFALGEALSWGQGCPQDLPRAKKCFEKAAERGHLSSIYALGVCYEWGRGICSDPAHAMECYERVADSGNLWIDTQLKSSPLWGKKHAKNK